MEADSHFTEDGIDARGSVGELFLWLASTHQNEVVKINYIKLLL